MVGVGEGLGPGEPWWGQQLGAAGEESRPKTATRRGPFRMVSPPPAPKSSSTPDTWDGFSEGIPTEQTEQTLTFHVNETPM